jgi:hypothetical protein
VPHTKTGQIPANLAERATVHRVGLPTVAT